MMPGWLGTIAASDPVSSTAGAIRELFHTPGIGEAPSAYWIDGQASAGAFLWPVALMAVFLPLAIRWWQRLSD
jgi:ABC-2 type transport system permease protein